MRTGILTALLALFLCGQPLSAQEVHPCYPEGVDSFLTQIPVIAEPWEENTATFANGEVRLAILDTWDPANYPMHLMILYISPRLVEAEGRACVIISDFQGYGFQTLTLEGMGVNYEASTGLTFKLAGSRYDPQTSVVSPGALTVILNRASDQVTANYQ